MSVKEALHKLIDEVIGEPATAFRRLELHELVEHEEPQEPVKSDDLDKRPEGD